MKTDRLPDLDRIAEVLQHDKQREAEAIRRKSITVEGGLDGEWLLKLPFAGRGMSNIRLSTGEMFDFAISVMALDPVPGDLVLDLGAGSCWVSEWLNRLLVDTVSLDYAHDMLAIGRQRLEPGAQLSVGDFEKLPFIDGTFDGAICLSALHHVPDIPAALREICRVLKPDGAAVFSEAGAGHSIQPKSRAEMEELGVLERDIVVDDLLDECLTAGFKTVYVQPCVFPPPTYTQEMWHTIQRATWPAGMPRRDLRQVLGAVIGTASSLGRIGWDRLVAALPGMNSFLPPGPPIGTSGLFLSWQSLLLNRNAVLAHPLVIAHKAQRIPDSRRPNILKAEITVLQAPSIVSSGSAFTIATQIRNTGDTFWRHETTPLGGFVALGAKLMNEQGLAVVYDYGRGYLRHDVAPGENLLTEITLTAPAVPGRYLVKLDMVDECIVWFEHRGARAVFVPIKVFGEQP
jgi:SAM-dependent methyltransferase